MVPRWASALLVWSVLALPALSAFCPQASAADDIVSVVLPGTDFQAAREALIESIEEEGRLCIGHRGARLRSCSRRIHAKNEAAGMVVLSTLSAKLAIPMRSD